MRIFVTGGSGFVGGHVIESLSPTHELLALARSDGSAEVVRGYGASPVRGHLGAVPESALAGVDAVVHCAAFVQEWGTREQFWAGNVEGTRQLLDAARAAGVKRFIHISTEAVLFDGGDLIDVDESHPYPRRQRFLYSETKAEAERLVLAANDDAITTIALRPRFIWGPRDQTVLPAVVRMAQQGGFAWIDGGRRLTSTTHVANLVHAIELALEHGQGGRAYFVTDGEDRPMREMLTSLAATRGVILPERSIPGWLARAVARLSEGAWRLLRIKRPPKVTSFAASMLSRQVTVRIDAARAELGYEPVVTVADGLAALTDTARAKSTGQPRSAA
ncbi:NAD-dependent epimerase/dehydratase family protein [Haliangium sp.]|uniref:NAD-dependent epimerase/dehydratase family protein n=1 Tax=Haliangium sp. TaxID=2663208 RepID=UPI003D0C390F